MGLSSANRMVRKRPSCTLLDSARMRKFFHVPIFRNPCNMAIRVALLSQFHNPYPEIVKEFALRRECWVERFRALRRLGGANSRMNMTYLGKSQMQCGDYWYFGVLTCGMVRVRISWSSSPWSKSLSQTTTQCEISAVI